MALLQIIIKTKARTTKHCITLTYCKLTAYIVFLYIFVASCICLCTFCIFFCNRKERYSTVSVSAWSCID